MTQFDRKAWKAGPPFRRAHISPLAQRPAVRKAESFAPCPTGMLAGVPLLIGTPLFSVVSVLERTHASISQCWPSCRRCCHGPSGIPVRMIFSGGRDLGGKSSSTQSAPWCRALGAT